MAKKKGSIALRKDWVRQTTLVPPGFVEAISNLTREVGGGILGLKDYVVLWALKRALEADPDELYRGVAEIRELTERGRLTLDQLVPKKYQPKE